MKKLVKMLPIVAVIFLFSSCDVEKCVWCEVLGHPEHYIPARCGTEDMIADYINYNEKKYAPFKIRCIID